MKGSQSFLLKWSTSKGAWSVESLKYRTIGGQTRLAGTELVPYDTPLSAGTGFWFCRHAGPFTFTYVPPVAVK